MPSGLSNSMLGYGPRTPQDYPGLEQEFNSLQAQSEACETYIGSQRHQGWVLARTRYDGGGFSGGTMERPALQGLLTDIRAGRIDLIA
jgi:DNA invertase Pin-like site-specific DNA recombinase